MGVSVIKHGLYGTTEYNIHKGIIQRCYDVNSPDYERYGKRGIKVCRRWRKGEEGLTGIECFLSDVGKRPSVKHSIERMDNDKGYNPKNCRWATKTEQQRNREYSRKVLYRGKLVHVKDLVEKFGSKVSASTVYNRINRGMSVKEALGIKAINAIVKINYKGKKLRIGKAIKLSGSGMTKGGVVSRLKRGWSVEKALETPPMTGKNKKKYDKLGTS